MFLVIELEIVFYLFEFCAGAHTILNNKKSLDMNQDLFAKLVRMFNFDTTEYPSHTFATPVAHLDLRYFSRSFFFDSSR